MLLIDSRDFLAFHTAWKVSLGGKREKAAICFLLFCNLRKDVKIKAYHMQKLSTYDTCDPLMGKFSAVSK